MIVASIAQIKSVNNDSLSNDFFDQLHHAFNEHLYTCGDRDTILDGSKNSLIELKLLFLPITTFIYILYRILIYHVIIKNTQNDLYYIN